MSIIKKISDYLGFYILIATGASIVLTSAWLVFGEVGQRQDNTENIEEIQVDVKQINTSLESLNEISESIDNMNDSVVDLYTETAYSHYLDTIKGLTTSQQILDHYLDFVIPVQVNGGRRAQTITLCRHNPEKMGFPLTEIHRKQICFKLERAINTKP